jgi:malate synthase
MEDMATGEIRLSILWEWLHKGAILTEDDAGTGIKAGDIFSKSLYEKINRTRIQKTACSR